MGEGSLRDSRWGAATPRAEALGYSQMSLRDGRKSGIRAQISFSSLTDSDTPQDESEFLDVKLVGVAPGEIEEGAQFFWGFG